MENIQESVVSDRESCVSGLCFDQSPLSSNGLVPLFPVDRAHYQEKCEISKTLEHGFRHCGMPENSGLYGCCLYLSPDNSPMKSVKNAMADKNGLRYLMLCRVILGKAELVQPGSRFSAGLGFDRKEE
ncbi:putative inactive poly [ADP-ribose] polymerase SRO5-like protein [Corchorus capsularis]|uniref:Putative inactive poly [ADP-ribose] polymerase SRO5-like protein n=1 Tax=Corchorus capsularis TaxID=210143 RepID=A0A1R3I384_COCAP|nr:putative inactive poly [ADP-ribose] polymerase SRO5-like protein [Corchorus capsularis]